MSKLPEIYKNKKVVNNNREVFYSFEKDKDDRTFSKDDIVFNELVTIKTKDSTYVTKILSKLNDHILTSNKDIIYLRDIKAIERKDHH